MSNRKHKGFVSRFEHTCSTSPPSTHEGFPLCLIPMDHSSVPQHLQALGLASPVHTASSLARQGRTSNKSSHTNSKPPRTHLSASSKNKEEISWWSRILWSPITNSYNTILWIDKAMDSSSDCEKIRIESMVKNSRKSLLTLLIKTLLLIGNICS